ncbi:hypothetical protein Ppa06_35340 [Planomonospora parontospora subsp. parontospora]|uniref:DUF5666 domain-containing protein n=2 Tax=Planomonospora parontospora TaxID=58119 RepID=A0AA37BHD7_9ACTN|nr:hypothetical protein [Planomonospora parontospora]GGK70949.1 hypothetical protein GCM10010126_33120 [Planomonospora parontospora]GII09736.1 hypothetical protein Ppa06_35340 [Planomonospora parontospora subsp. parontospora]
MADSKKDGEELLASSPFAGDLDRELAVRPARSFSTLTLALAAGVMLVLGMVAGIQVQKAMGGGSAGAAAQPGGGFAGPGGQRGMGGTGGQGQGGQGQAGQGSGGQGRQGQAGQGQGGQRGGPGGGATVGTVRKVEDGKVYVQTMDGSVVTVTTTGETAVRISKEGKVTDLRTGGTVVVQGVRGEDGSVAATSISEGGARGR